MILRNITLWAVICLSPLVAWSAQLTSIALMQQKNQNALVFTLNGAFTHKVFFLSAPERVVVDFKDTKLAAAIKQDALTNALIKQVRVGHLDSTTIRVVFDVRQKVQLRSSLWQSAAGQGVRIDLVANRPLARSPIVVSTLPIKASAGTKPSAPLKAPHIPIKISNKPNKTLRDVVIVLDAGHGGKDVGASGPHRTREKDVVLAISLKLKHLIDRQPGMRAVLTRSGDYYVGLRQRLDIARKYNGDVFVAIHADAFNNPHSNGASVFALSQRGATSEAARWLAEKENYSELGGVNLGDLDDRNGVVRSVLIDLSQTATINSGLEMGQRVLRQLGGFTNLHNSRVEQARFVVLKSPDIPSILVETGFISNPREERNLTDAAYQMRLSQAIFQGIKGYFWDNPPHGSRLEAMLTHKFHVVRAGESLPTIAARYRTSVAKLQEMNHLHAHINLSPGQKLVIPTAWA